MNAAPPAAQTTNRLFAVRPTAFGFNPETAATNSFQVDDRSLSPAEITARATREFDGLLGALRAHGVDVHVVADADPDTTDAVFPNNWISLHADGHVVLYPMLSPRRRREVRPDIVARLEAALGVRWPHVVDLTPLAEEGAFLEGTGSVVLDRAHRIAYACRSPRTTERGLSAFADRVGYTIVAFDAADADGAPVYHTNVVMGIGTRFAAVCLDAIPDAEQRADLRTRFEATGHTVIPLTNEQRDEFAGNLLAVRGADDVECIVMSERARASLNAAQRTTLESFGRIVSAPLDTIERLGGGSARCMLAEIHAP